MNDKDFHRFFSRVLITPGCWLWTGSISSTGYGNLYLQGKVVNAHKACYEHYEGEVPKGLELLHRCDIRNCVNPSHLKPGTHRENQEDAGLKNRLPFGEAHWACKLTDADVLEILDLLKRGPYSQRHISRIYGVSDTAIRRIKSGKRKRL